MMNSLITFKQNKFMENIIIGVDISSKTLDICIKSKGSLNYFTIDNTIPAIKGFLKSYKTFDVILAMENTGRYNWNLLSCLESYNFKVYVIPPLHLKRSIGLTRGKNDKIDALRICHFIEKNKQETRQWEPSPVPVRKIKILLTERTSRMKIRKQLLAQQHDYKLFRNIDLHKELHKLNQELVEKINLQIKAIESMLEEVISSDQNLFKQQQLIKSVPGVGKVLSWSILAKTEGFTLISNPRKMACYSGVAPFDFQSGTSIKKRPGVSVLADKSLKTLLHMAAMSAVRRVNDLGNYYLRKVAEGKNKMSVLNAVRNKIIHRIFAVIRNENFYQKDLLLS